MDCAMQAFDLEQLRTFVAVTEAGSLTAAAPQVFLSQSAVSEQMRKLEERAGQSLLTPTRPFGICAVKRCRANCGSQSPITSGRAT
jgi:hypothetical protein